MRTSFREGAGVLAGHPRNPSIQGAGCALALETNYMGLHLRSPLVASPSPLTRTLDGMRQLEDAGIAAVILPSLFEEQVRRQFNDPSWSLTHGIEPYPPHLSYLPNEEDYQASPDMHLDRIQRASQALSVPVIASLNGATSGDWTSFAAQMEQAGADAIELCIYHVPTVMAASSLEVEQDYIEMVKSIRRQISIPLAVKVSPFITSFSNFAQQIVDAGANGLVFFNRIFNVDVNLTHTELTHDIHWTTSADIELPLRWISILRERIATDFAATSGIHCGEDALKLIYAGADVTMLCSVLLEYGVPHIQRIENELLEWMDIHGHDSLNTIRGRMRIDRCEDMSAFERANYIWAVGTKHSKI